MAGSSRCIRRRIQPDLRTLWQHSENLPQTGQPRIKNVRRGGSSRANGSFCGSQWGDKLAANTVRAIGHLMAAVEQGHRQRRLAGSCCVLLVLLLAPGRASAYALYSYESAGETLYLKWGDNHAGTPAGVLTWSLMPAGTPGNPGYCGDACPGASLAALNIEIAPGGGFALHTLAELQGRIAAAMARWSLASGIALQRLATDSGVAINDPAAMPAATGHIRIGIFAFASGGGAVGYAPPPNGGSGAGDILFDANSFYQFAPGNEGDSFDPSFAPNDFDSLLMHELGHALGLDHPEFDGSCPVMQVHPACAARINRIPDADDIAGLSFLYQSLFSDGFEP